ncbi:MAG: carboxypeptidase regulatory-like domain-containing protein [Gemmatirosa sp.]
MTTDGWDGDWDGGWDGEHLGEATAHAWLDGALPPAEAARAESHVATCADCAALVAEARGLIGGASRVLGALDAVPAGVLPAAVPMAPPVPAAARRPWWTRVPARAAAAALLLAGGSAIVLRDGGAPAPSTQDAAIPAPELSVSAAPAAPAPALASDEVSRPAPDSTAVAAATPTRAVLRSPGPPALDAERRTDQLASAKARPAPATLAAPAVAMAPAPPTPVSGTVAGRVLTPEGRPVAAAEVQLVGGSGGAAVTDDSGAFVLHGVRAGPATLQARRAGYQPQVALVVVGGADTASTTVVLRQEAGAPSAAAVTGAVADAPRAQFRERLARESARALAQRSVASMASPAGAPHGIVGCYLLTASSGAAPGLRPTWIALDSTRATPRDAGRASFVARTVPDGPAVWTPLGGDSLRVRWPDEPGEAVLRPAPADPGALTGRLGARPVTARRVACTTMPAR